MHGSVWVKRVFWKLIWLSPLTVFLFRLGNGPRIPRLASALKTEQGEVHLVLSSSVGMQPGVQAGAHLPDAQYGFGVLTTSYFALQTHSNYLILLLT